MNAVCYKLIATLFGIGVTLHNLEEAMFLVSCSRTHLKLPFPQNAKIYWVLTSLASLVIWIFILGVRRWPQNSDLQCVLSGIALVAAVNAVLPHLLISLVKRSYSPGTGTGMLFNLPLGVWLIHEQLKAGVISAADLWRRAVPYGALLAVVAFGSLFGAHAIAAWKRSTISHDDASVSAKRSR
jgi:Protein of unknown function with HXXEE motif